MKLLFIFRTTGKEYVVNLKKTHKLMKSNLNEPVIQINDGVIVHKDILPRSLWRIGVVKEIHKCRDNQIRRTLA